MKIALDFDGTFTADPLFWTLFIRAAAAKGHEVRIVTMRCDIKDGISWPAVYGFPNQIAPAPVIWCDGAPKKEFCKAAGWEPDVWIDDDPRGIIHGSVWRGQDPPLVAWRDEDPYKNPAVAKKITAILQRRKA